MSGSYDKIIADLEKWRAFAGNDAALGQMIADSHAMSTEARRVAERLDEQRRQIAERFGKPEDRVFKGLQLKGRKPPAGAMDDGDGAFGAEWPGADAVLAKAREKGADLDDGMAALIKYTDRMIKAQAKDKAKDDGGDSRAERAAAEIAKMNTPRDGVVALIYGASAYLSHVLQFQVFERLDDAYGVALKADGIDDMAKVVLGGLADKLPFAGVTYGFVTAMADFEDQRTESVADAGGCMEFLKVYKLQLHMWKSGALRHATVADALIEAGG